MRKQERRPVRRNPRMNATLERDQEGLAPERARHRFTPARYRRQLVPEYRGNPAIEALPPLLSEEEAYLALRYLPPYSSAALNWPATLRRHALNQVKTLFVPLPHCVELEQTFGTVIRSGYVARNPLADGFSAGVNQAVKRLRDPHAGLAHVTATNGFDVIGPSGIGKSTTIKAILNLYGQVIIHCGTARRPLLLTQVVWMHIQCPRNGTLGGLVRNFFQELDRILGTTYYHDFVEIGRRTIEDYLPVMAKLALRHHLGVLVIDEIQNVVAARGVNDGELLNFLVELDNVLHVPIVLVGTPKTMSALGGEFRRARRATGAGGHDWRRMEEDEVFDEFARELFRYRYVRGVCAPTPDLVHALYDTSQGITDVAVKVFVQGQIAAIVDGGEEDLTPELFRRVSERDLGRLQPYLGLLRDLTQARAAHEWDKVALLEPRLRAIEDLAPFELLESDMIPDLDSYIAADVTAPVAAPVAAPVDDSAPSPGVTRRQRGARKMVPAPQEEAELLAIWRRSQAENRETYDALSEEGWVRDPCPALGWEVDGGSEVTRDEEDEP